RYDHPTNAGHHRSLMHLLTAFGDTDPDRPIGSIDQLDRVELHRMLEECNDTARSIPRLTFPELVERQVARTPAAPAVAGPAARPSVPGLTRRANRLAWLLIARGIGPEQVVALAGPRSVGFLVAALAVLKAGAAYLPVDPRYPAERIAFMLDDARP